jgi:Uma2 family endonuclease
MSAVLEVPHPVSTAPSLRRFTVKDYYRMLEAGILHEDDHVELIRGEIRTMSPKGPKHASGNSRANRYFAKLLGEQVIIRIQDPIHLDDFSEPEPDVVLAALAEDEYDYHHPTPAEIYLVLEIADSSLDYDRDEKSKLYAQAGIRQYCILNVRERELEDYRQPGAQGYRSKQTYTAEQRFTLAAFPHLAVEVGTLLPRPDKSKQQRKRK